MSLTFQDLPLSRPILRGLEDLGFSIPTPIQQHVIPQALMGNDICALAQTGSGKTAAYTLPIIDVLAASRKRAKLPRGLILVPTRELAQQVALSFDSMGKYVKDFTYAVVIGGESPFLQEKALKKGVDVVIATPGRLLDHFERGNLSFLDISMVVIDEADRMLDMGFVPDIERIMALIPVSNHAQKLCLSATMPAPIQKLVDEFLKNPKQIVIESEIKPSENVEQIFIKNAGLERAKRSALRELLKKQNIDQAIIFCNRKMDVDLLARSLRRYRFKAGALHGDMTQGSRTEVMEEFKAKTVSLLIASDIAARGIDIEKMPYVINFDVPINADEYVHRVGRTGRAGHKGRAYTFVDDEKSPLYERIKDFIPEDAAYIDASVELEFDPFKEIGYRKPGSIDNFSFPVKPTKGFGKYVPNFMNL